MKTYYVSLVKDLIGVYLIFEAESELAVRQYLIKEYWKNNTWGLPWCAVYEVIPEVPCDRRILIYSSCGPLYEEKIP